MALATIASAQTSVTLDEALAAARSNRPALDSARLRVSQARLSSRAQGAYPTTRLFAGYSTDPEAGGTDDDLVLAQPLDIFGRTRAGRRSGSALIAQAEASLRQVQLAVQTEVVGAFVEAASAAEMAKSSRSVLAVFERLHEATRLRVEGGVAPGFHLTQVSLDLEQSRLKAEQRETEARSALQLLLAQTGQADVVPTGLPPLSVQVVPDDVVVQQRPDLLLLAADVQAAKAEIDLARLSGMPELELQGRRTPWQQSDSQYGVRLQLSIPVFDSGRARAETRAASIRTEAAERALADATKIAIGEAHAAQTEMEAAQGQVARYDALVAAAKGLVERLRPGLTEQATTLIEVLDASRILRDVEQASIEAKARLAKAQARYIQATGQLLEVRP